MQGTKCDSCGLMNFASEVVCRRCGMFVDGSAARNTDHTGPREAAKRSSSLYTLLVLAVIAAGVYYFYSGVDRSFEKISSDEAKRVAAQPPQQPFTSRSDADRQRTETYKSAVKDSPGIAQADKRMAETQKLMQPAR